MYIRFVRGCLGWDGGFCVRGHAIVSGNFSLSVDVDFAKDYFAWLAFCGCELFKDGRDDLARAAPVGVEVDYCEGRRGCDCTEVR